MEKSLVYGGRCGELQATFDHELSSWKMLQTSFDWAAPMLLDHLPQSGIIVSGLLYAVDQTSEHRTTDPAGFVLPTPTASTNYEPKDRGCWRRSTVCNHILGVKAAQWEGVTQDQAIGENLVLRPQFVEWMMGFPQGWTAPSTTESEKHD